MIKGYTNNVSISKINPKTQTRLSHPSFHVWLNVSPSSNGSKTSLALFYSGCKDVLFLDPEPGCKYLPSVCGCPQQCDREQHRQGVEFFSQHPHHRQHLHTSGKRLIIRYLALPAAEQACSLFCVKDILDTANVLVDDRSTAAWNTLNNPNYTGTNNLSSAPEVIQTMSDSSAFLASIEAISISLSDDPDLNIFTERITLNRSRFSGSFSANLSMVSLELPGPHRDNSFITTINFNSLDNVLLPSNASGANTSNVINGNVLLVLSNSSVDNVTFTFDILNPNLTSPQCVFWNFSLLDNEGAWDGTGCTAGVSDAQIVTCNCNHLTSFSILMSPFSPQSEILDYITYIGVGISLLSLVICLIIEAIIWRKINRNSTSYLRHTCIVNIAVSLLIANIWFIIGAFVSDSGSVNPPACFAVTFFIHFFYLSLFFWMLMSGLLLLYRTISVFGGGLSDGGMVAVGFSVGYGAPLLIAVVTIAVTKGTCWLTYEGLLRGSIHAFLLPVGVVVLTNLFSMCVVILTLTKTAVPDDNKSDAETAKSILKVMLFLTPAFGLTWILGFVMLFLGDSSDEASIDGSTQSGLMIFITYAFTILNSFQVRGEPWRVKRQCVVCLMPWHLM
uniref:Uncharacterized protein n=1 Tax=Gadus morhua TaxID=8049 RepID=A0A8C4Z0W0_GADMO